MTQAAITFMRRGRRHGAVVAPAPLAWPAAALLIGLLSAGLWLGIFRLAAALL